MFDVDNIVEFMTHIINARDCNSQHWSAWSRIFSAHPSFLYILPLLFARFIKLFNALFNSCIFIIFMDIGYLASHSFRVGHALYSHPRVETYSCALVLLVCFIVWFLEAHGWLVQWVWS